jgi:hypothetical protein
MTHKATWRGGTKGAVKLKRSVSSSTFYCGVVDQAALKREHVTADLFSFFYINIGILPLLEITRDRLI